MSQLKVLFLCGGNSCRSQMAEGFLREMGGDRFLAYSAGIRAEGVHPRAVEVMKEAGVDISKHTSKTVADLGPVTFDLIISLCEEAEEYCSVPIEENKSRDKPEKCNLFIGVPPHLHWPVPDPAEARGDEKTILSEFRSARDSIRDNVKAVVELGQLTALASQRQRLEQVIDAMEDGIIVHDQHRNIFMFNRAAEEITGFSREEVLGSNCHQVFQPDGLCGSNCPMDSFDPESFRGVQYEVNFTNKRGEDKRLRIHSAPFSLHESGPKGVFASIRDVTEVSQLRWELKEKHSFHGMVGVSEAMQDVFQTIRQVTISDYPVLITGESGTGKELVARAIHNESRRSGGPFVPINCGALPENILESELFGHVRGAFTGAIRDKKGRFELAHKGTILLDELGELSPAFQVKLLRVLEEKQFEPVGGERTIRVNVRVISATNRDLKKLIEEGVFREDLFYRISVVPIHLPPLRKRQQDLPFLVEQILKNIRRETGKEIRSLSNEAMDMLVAYSWPGNIRELINVLQFASVRCNKDEILHTHLPPEIRNPATVRAHHGLAEVSAAPLKKRRKLDNETVAQALAEVGGNKVKAAKLLGVGRATLYRFLEKHPVS